MGGASFDDETLVGEQTPSGPTPSASTSELPREQDGPPRTIGRHLVIEPLGIGGMGIVYAAYDPELDRKLAIKLIRPGRGSELDRDRLLREAQAMAKVSHTNVIAVYDVGMHAGQVYIAMEYVQGKSLGQHLREVPAAQRDWYELLTWFRQAGAGLAAAHDVGLVHRDFKPDNVLVGEDSRVRVLDFGLARATNLEAPDHADASEPPTEVGQAPATASAATPVPAMEETLVATASASQVSRASSSSLLQQQLTQIGELMGTPAYMPPEHLEGAVTDARGDQFSFCVSLWEALYGTRPFVGRSLPELFERLSSSNPTPPPPPLRARIPDWLHQTVERGLSREPEDRWPDMAALVERLQPPVVEDPRTPGWPAVAAVVAAVAVAVGAAALRLRDTPSVNKCGREAMEKDIDAIWGPPQRAALTDRFAGSGQAPTRAWAEQTAGALDAWSTAWTDARVETCEATRVEASQSEQLLDLRMACYDRQLSELRALAGAIEDGTPEVLSRATAAAVELPDLARCADTERLLARAEHRPPEALREQVDDWTSRLHDVQALRRLGQYVQARAGVEELLVATRDSEWLPIRGESHLERARIADAAGEHALAIDDAVEAWSLALESGDDELAVEALVALLWSERHSAAHREAFVRHVRAARGLLARVGAPALRARVHEAEGHVHFVAAHAEPAIAAYREAEEVLVDAFGVDDPRVTGIQSRRASVLVGLGRLDEAEAIYLDVRERYVQRYGEAHPLVWQLDMLRGKLEWQRADLDAAQELFASALEGFEEAFGPDSPRLVALIGNMGALAMRRRQPERALEYFERAIALGKGRAEDKEFAGTLDNYAGLLMSRKDYDASRKAYTEAHAVRVRLLGERHPEVARSLVNMAALENADGHPERAKPMLERAIELRAASDVDVIYRARARWQLAEALYMLGEHEAIPDLLDAARRDYDKSERATEKRGFEAAAERLQTPP